MVWTLSIFLEKCDKGLTVVDPNRATPMYFPSGEMETPMQACSLSIVKCMLSWDILEAAVPCLGNFLDFFLFFLDSSKERGEGASRFLSNLYWW